MVNWKVSYTLQYLEPINFAGLCSIELLEIAQFKHSIMCK